MSGAAACVMLGLRRMGAVKSDSCPRKLVAAETGRATADLYVHQFFEPIGGRRGPAYNFYALRQPDAPAVRSDPWERKLVAAETRRRQLGFVGA